MERFTTHFKFNMTADMTCGYSQNFDPRQCQSVPDFQANGTLNISLATNLCE